MSKYISFRTRRQPSSEFNNQCPPSFASSLGRQQHLRLDPPNIMDSAVGENGDEDRSYRIHCVPLTSSSDIWSFRLYGQFLAGPERNGISYNKIFRIFGQYSSKFRIYGQFYGNSSLKTNGINTHIWLFCTLPAETRISPEQGQVSQNGFRSI